MRICDFCCTFARFLKRDMVKLVMKKIFDKRGLILVMMSLLALCVYADDSFTIAHEFNTPGDRIVYSNANKTAKTDSVVYQCYNGAKFYLNSSTGNKISLFMENRLDSMVTSKIVGLKSIRLYYFPQTVDRYATMAIKVSRDGVHWIDVTSRIEHIAGRAEVVIPQRGNYFVKVINTGSSVPFYIWKFQWYIEICNCFEYLPNGWD